MFCLGGFCPGGFWQGGFLSRGFLSGGLCPGGFCLGGFVLEPVTCSFFQEFYSHIDKNPGEKVWGYASRQNSK